MAIELKFARSDSQTQWGFRLVGGADFETPLIVVKVNDNSLAEQLGLQEGDIIVRINDKATAGLTHTQAHDLLSSAGNEFDLGVRRGDITYYTQWINDIENNIEVSEILKDTILEEDQETLNKEQANLISLNSTVNTDVILENLGQTKNLESCDNEAIKNITLQSSSEQVKIEQETVELKSNIVDVKNKKWSTFLQKPKNVKPIPKKIEQERQIQGEPYRVIIKKQKKKSQQEEKAIKYEDEITEYESEINQENFDEYESNEIEVESQQIKSEIEVEVSITENEEINVYEESCEEMDNDEIGIDETEETIVKETIIETSLTLEEQLLQVQRQLQALAQLPTEIQVTLDAVSQQLAHIVGVKQKIENEENEEDKQDENSESDNMENNLIKNEDDEDYLSEKSEKDAPDQEEADEDRITEELNEINENEVYENDEQNKVISPENLITEEEIEAKRLEEEKLAKKQKEMDLRPIQRPIILPGGRKWTEPDDACPSVRNPKMTDEKIATTIETYSEVIVGKAKGLTIGMKSGPGLISTNPSTGYTYKCSTNKISINFLKYEPPPKNLDYLQRSEVYKLVHDMEPPVKGISNRMEKILSEQDYYSKGAP